MIDIHGLSETIYLFFFSVVATAFRNAKAFDQAKESYIKVGDLQKAMNSYLFCFFLFFFKYKMNLILFYEGNHIESGDVYQSESVAYFRVCVIEVIGTPNMCFSMYLLCFCCVH